MTPEEAKQFALTILTIVVGYAMIGVIVGAREYQTRPTAFLKKDNAIGAGVVWPLWVVFTIIDYYVSVALWLTKPRKKD